jgi:hypothetical protein
MQIDKQTIGQEIDNLINTHIKLWHCTSPARKDLTLDNKTRVELFMKTRDYNVLRAELRDVINKHFNSGYPDPKINYKGTK